MPQNVLEKLGERTSIMQRCGFKRTRQGLGHKRVQLRPGLVAHAWNQNNHKHTARLTYRGDFVLINNK